VRSSWSLIYSTEKLTREKYDTFRTNNAIFITMTPSQNRKQYTTSDPSPGSSARFIIREIHGEIRRTLAKRIVQLVTILIFFFLVFITIPLLKWMLGIYTIESHLDRIQTELSDTEDTVFSYKYDYFVPAFDREIEILKNKGINTPANVFAKDFGEFIELKEQYEFDDEEWILLQNARDQLRQPVARTFYFSSGKSNTETTLYYEFECHTSTGSQQHLPPFTVEVNGHKMEPYNDKEGRHDVKEKLTYNDTITTGSSQMYKQALSLEFFGSEEAVDIHSILDGSLTRCAFDAMIFVRDLPTPFEAFKLTDMMPDLIRRSGS